MYCFIVSRGGGMRVGQARRRDAAEAPIKRDLEQLGYHVTQVSGEGAPDLLVRKCCWAGECWGFEVKSDDGRRTDSQERTQWPIVRSLEDVLECMGVVLR